MWRRREPVVAAAARRAIRCSWRSRSSYSAEHYVVGRARRWLCAVLVHLAASGSNGGESGAAPVDTLDRTPRARRPWRSRARRQSALARNDAVVNLSKRRGFVFPSSEIYGGTRSAWDYGPLGVELKENVRRQWWRTMVTSRDDIVGLDSAVILAPQVWEASGHVATFSDPLTECQHCHHRFRADHLEEEFEARKGRAPQDGLTEIACPNCGTRGQWTEPKQFSGMLRDLPRPGRGRVGAALPAPRDRAGHLRQLPQRADHRAQEAAVRHRADRQELPQRDHAGQLHLPHPRVRADGDGVLRRARHGRAVARVLARAAVELVRRPGHRRRTTCASSSTRRRSCRTTRRAPSTSSTASASAARSSPSSRASPTAPTST